MMFQNLINNVNRFVSEMIQVILYIKLYHPIMMCQIISYVCNHMLYQIEPRNDVSNCIINDIHML